MGGPKSLPHSWREQTSLPLAHHCIHGRIQRGPIVGAGSQSESAFNCPMQICTSRRRVTLAYCGRIPVPGSVMKGHCGGSATTMKWGFIMLLFQRVLRIAGGSAAGAWAAEVTASVNKHAVSEVSLWSGAYGMHMSIAGKGVGESASPSAAKTMC